METNKRYNWPVLTSTVYQVQFLINHTSARKRIVIIKRALEYAHSIDYVYQYSYEKKTATGIDKKTYPKLTLSADSMLLLKLLIHDHYDTGCTYSSMLCDVINVYCEYIVSLQNQMQKKLI